MMIFVQSHRYTKGDKFIIETQEAVEASSEIEVINHADFTIVRDVMYRYSKKA